MDSYEATRVVFSRIQNLDPENASKIMGLLLIQDHGEKEMIRLAFGPESLVHSVILKARIELGISSNTSSAPSTPSSPLPFNNQISLSRQNSSSSSSSLRILNGTTNLPSPLSIPNPSSSWASSSFSEDFSPGMNSLAPPFYNGETDLMDEIQMQEHLAFLNDGSVTLGPNNKPPDFYYPSPDLSSPNVNPNGNGDSLFFNGGWGHHRRSCSVSDINLGSDDPNGGFGWKPCLYFARGYCKNGTSCRFVHSGGFEADGGAMVGSPSKMEMMEQCHELLRSKSVQHQRLAASQLMANANFPYSPNKCMNLLLQQQQQPLQVDGPRAAAASMMGDEMHKFGRSRLDRNEFLNGGAGMVNPGSRQIYLTFPADSTFSEEDVSNYFSIYGPVQDVRIPYQQKRMFGFVTFHYPETVKLILAKGNPHFVCDARVLVKPYKEKGKVPDKFRKQQQQMERGDFSACGSPTGLDSRDPFDLQLGQRMFYNTQDLLWRRKLEEQADLQQAIELQSRRLMGLQLLDVKRNSHHQRAFSTGAAISPPIHSPNFFNATVLPSSGPNSPELTEENSSVTAMGNAATVANLCENEKESSNQNEENGNGKGSPPNLEESDLQESLEHNLPDSLFASPKAAGEYPTVFLNDGGDKAEKSGVAAPSSSANNNSLIAAASPLVPATSTLDMASLKSCYFQAPRFASSHGAIGM
ncbi:hypothetical protein LguiB_011232 [Lonicera macranthoides]